MASVASLSRPANKNRYAVGVGTVSVGAIFNDMARVFPAVILEVSYRKGHAHYRLALKELTLFAD
jgi:hypothetical protein